MRPVEDQRQNNLWDGRQVKRATDENYKANRPRILKIAAAVDRLARPAASGAIRVLNIGAGDARLEGLLIDRSYDVHMLDPSEDVVDFVRKKYKLDDTKVRRGWSQQIPFEDGAFDFVVMSEVLEHLSDGVLRRTLDEVHRVLSGGGYFLGTVPDNEDLSANSYRCLHCGKVSHRVGHEWTFTGSTLRETLSSRFDVLEITRFRGMHMNWRGLVYFYWIDFPYKVARMLKPEVRAPHQIVFNLFFSCRRS